MKNPNISNAPSRELPPALKEKIIAEAQKKKIERAQKEDAALREKFDRVLKGRFHHISPTIGGFEPKLGPSYTYISVFPNENGTAANVVVYFEAKSNKGEWVERNVTGSIGENGILNLRLPKELAEEADNDKIFRAILDHFETKNLDKCLNLAMFNGGQPLEIIPPGPWDSPELKNKGPEHSRAAIDSARLDFLLNQPDLIMAIAPGTLTRIEYGRSGRYGTGKQIGTLSDYHAFVFPRGAIFENAVEENNIYYYLYNQALSPDDIEKISGFLDRKRQESVTEEELKEFLKLIGLHKEMAKNKKTLMAEGKKYVESHASSSKPANRQQFYQNFQHFINTFFV